MVWITVALSERGPSFRQVVATAAHRAAWSNISCCCVIMTYIEKEINVLDLYINLQIILLNSFMVQFMSTQIDFFFFF